MVEYMPPRGYVGGCVKRSGRFDCLRHNEWERSKSKNIVGLETLHRFLWMPVPRLNFTTPFLPT